MVFLVEDAIQCVLFENLIMRIYLTGFMGSGKSIVGRLLAETRKVPFLDLDREIEHLYAHSIAEMFDARGEAFFREMESATLKRLQQDPSVISTGGGCFIYNKEWMLQNGVVIYLEVPFEQIVQRIGGDPARPLWRNAARLYTERSADYSQAHHTVNGSGTPEEVVERIKNLSLPE